MSTIGLGWVEVRAAMVEIKLAFLFFFLPLFWCFVGLRQVSQYFYFAFFLKKEGRWEVGGERDGYMRKCKRLVVSI